MSSGYRDNAEGLRARLEQFVVQIEARRAQAPDGWWAARHEAAELDALARRVRSAARDDAGALHAALATAELWARKIDAALRDRYAEVAVANIVPDGAPSAAKLTEGIELGIGNPGWDPRRVGERLRELLARAELSHLVRLSPAGDTYATFERAGVPLGLVLLDPGLDPHPRWHLGVRLRSSQGTLRVRPAGFFSSVGATLGLLTDALVGDEAFDREYLVDADEAAARHTLTEPVRAAVRALHEVALAFALEVGPGGARLLYQAPLAPEPLERGAAVLCALRALPPVERPPSR